VASGNGVTPVAASGRPACTSGTQFDWNGTSGGTQELASGRTLTVTFYSNTNGNRPANPAPGKPERYFRISATNAVITQAIVTAVPDNADESNVYGYAPVGTTADTKLHPPTNGNSQPYSLAAMRFCWAVPVTLSGTVFHDNDNDGLFDTPAGGSVESGLGGFTVNLLSGSTVVASTTSAAGTGAYSISVASGTYTLCLDPPDPVAVPGQTGVTQGWGQSTPTGNSFCGTAQAGYSANYTTDTANLNFGATEQWTIPEGGTATQTGDGITSVIDLTNCDKDLTAVFDVGVNSDEGNTQFILFGGADLGGNCKVRQTNTWAPYDTDYDANGNLVIPPTLVVLQGGGTPYVLENCEAGEPNNTGGRLDCRVSRTVSETADLADPPGIAGTQDAQITESEIDEFVFDITRAKN
jgi:hypothetical protein